jgi:hypothetical protein
MTKNIILPGEWKKTHAEKRGYVISKHGILEGGCQFSASKLRKDQAGDALQSIAKILWSMRQKMADLSWDDDNTMVAIGVQIRNRWVEIDGDWVEEDSPEWLARTAKTSIIS